MNTRQERHNLDFETLDQVNGQLRPKKNKKYHKVHSALLWTWNFLVIPELRNLSQKCAITGGLWCTWENCILITLPSTMVLIYFLPPTMIFTFLHSTTIVNNCTILYVPLVTISNLSRKFYTCLDGFKAVWIGWQLSVQFESFPDICPDSLKCVRTIWKVKSIRQPTGGSSLVICDMNSLHKQSLGWKLADAIILNWH